MSFSTMTIADLMYMLGVFSIVIGFVVRFIAEGERRKSGRIFIFLGFAMVISTWLMVQDALRGG